MNKRELAKLPRPQVTVEIRERASRKGHPDFLFTADRCTVADEDTLILNYFRIDNKSDRKVLPEFRTFFISHDYISQDLTHEKVKWKTGGVDALTNLYYWYKTKVSPLNGEDLQIMAGWFKDNRPEIEPDPQALCVSIRDERLKNKHDKIKAVIDEQMERFGAIPEDYDQFVKEKAFGEEEFIFYSKREKWAYCTKCS